MRRSGFRAAAVAGAIATALSVALGSWLMTGGPASADAPLRQGWWTVTNPTTPAGPAPTVPTPLPSPAPTTPVPVPSQPTAPDVPPDGLYVAAGPNGPTAYAAVGFLIPDGSTVSDLTLKTAASSATTPNAGLMICPLKPEATNFPPAQGGDIAAAPAYDCSRSVPGAPTPAADGFTFPAGSLVSNGELAVAILPAGPTDRVALAHPGDDALVVQSGSSGSSSSDSSSASSDFGAVTSPTPDLSPSTASSPSTPSTGSFSGGALPTGDGSAPPAVASPPAPAAASAPAVAPQAVAATPASATRGNASGKVLLMLAALLAAGLLWVAAGRAPTAAP